MVEFLPKNFKFEEFTQNLSFDPLNTF